MAKKSQKDPKAPLKKIVTPTRRPAWMVLRERIVSSLSAYLTRRPHRSFRMTRRRDYVRPLALPGYWAFTAYVWKTFAAHKRQFIGLILISAVLGAVFVGLASQDLYSQLSGLLDSTNNDTFTGWWGSVGQASLLLLSGLTGGLTPELTEAQQIYSVIFFLLSWLTTVWLLRATLSGARPRIRDGLYNAGAPIVSTGIVMAVLILQLVPGTIGVIVMNAAISTNLFSSGLLAMLISVGAGLLVLVSVYLVTSTLIALVVVTLPGMYPLQAIRTAGDLVVGRRLRILLRLGWSLLGTVVVWCIVVLAAILLDRGIKHVLPVINGLPLVPVVIALASAAIVVWNSGYTYLLYRKVVEDDAAPA
jgi:hypothetical protein